jgi:hypothetical protein
LGHLNFEFISHFVLRISELVNLANCYIKPLFLIGLICGTQQQDCMHVIGWVVVKLNLYQIIKIRGVQEFGNQPDHRMDLKTRGDAAGKTAKTRQGEGWVFTDGC